MGEPDKSRNKIKKIRPLKIIININVLNSNMNEENKNLLLKKKSVLSFN